MTDHVRTSYRNHQRATWGLVIAVVVAIAAVLVPLGSAKPPTAQIKLFDICLEGGATPCDDWSLTGGSTSTLSGSQVTLNILNESGSNTSLGSLNLDMPTGITLQLPVGAPNNSITGTSTSTRLQVRNLNLAAGSSYAVSFTVTAPNTCGTVTWTKPPAKQSNDFNGSGNDYVLKKWSGLTSLITAGCHLEWIHEPASAKQSQTITDTAFSDTGANVAVEIQDANDDPIDLDTGTASLAIVTGTFDPCGTSCPPTFAGLTSTLFQNGRATFPDLKSAYTGTGFTARASALGLQTAPSDPPFVVQQNGTDCLTVDPCLLSSSLTNGQVDAAARGGNFAFIAISNTVIDVSDAGPTNGGCANFKGGEGFVESDSRNGDGSLDFTISIPTSYLKKTYGPNFGQPNVPICIGVKRLNGSFQPIDCNLENPASGWDDRNLGNDGKPDGTFGKAQCGTDGFWYGIVGTKNDPKVDSNGNPWFDSTVIPLITAFGTSADGLSRTFVLHVPAPFDIKGAW